MLKNLSSWITTLFLCNIMGGHDWTCLVDQGIKPDPVKLKADPIGYFKEYSKIYCKRCGYESELNNRL